MARLGNANAMDKTETAVIVINAHAIINHNLYVYVQFQNEMQFLCSLRLDLIEIWIVMNQLSVKDT